MIEVRTCSTADILEQSDLIAEYAAESAIPGMPYRPEEVEKWIAQQNI